MVMLWDTPFPLSSSIFVHQLSFLFNLGVRQDGFVAGQCENGTSLVMTREREVAEAFSFCSPSIIPFCWALVGQVDDVAFSSLAELWKVTAVEGVVADKVAEKRWPRRWEGERTVSLCGPQDWLRRRCPLSVREPLPRECLRDGP